MYKKFLKIIISNLFIVLIALNQNAISKPLPPGSGTGDVPANILILLDSSASMSERLTAGNGIDIPGDIVEDSDGNLIIGEGNLGFLKILTADNTVDPTFLFPSCSSGEVVASQPSIGRHASASPWSCG